MKKYLIGNWKSNKTTTEVTAFFDEFARLYHQGKDKLPPNIIPVVCPVYIHLPIAKELIFKNNLPISLGAQDISPYNAGAYTGEVYADQLIEYAEFVIIGHSERRKYFLENDTLLASKLNQAKNLNLKSIYCVSDSSAIIPVGVSIIAYEPLFAIGTGKPDTPENAAKTIAEIKKKNSNIPVIYGGSVTADNIKSFLETDAIDGVLPGKSSLDPEIYYRMLINAAS